MPHISRLGLSEPQTRGRSGRPKIRQVRSGFNCTQATSAGLPFGIPGMGLVIEAAMQQAAQPGRQVTVLASNSASLSGRAGLAPDSETLPEPDPIPRRQPGLPFGLTGRQQQNHG